MEIAFFRTGITRTASDQSISLNSSQSGSLAIAASSSCSVIASTRAQSVLPFRRSPHFRVTIRSFFMFPRTPRRDDPNDFVSARENHGDQAIIQQADRDPALFVIAIRSPKHDRAVKDLASVFEVVAVLFKVRLFSSHSKPSNARISSCASAMRRFQLYIQLYCLFQAVPSCGYGRNIS